jgi:hypothetical protein
MDIHLMCELHVTVNVYRVERSLSDADWHFLTNNSRWILLNVSITTTEQTARKVWISNENQLEILSRNGLTLIWNCICTCFEIWNKKKRRMAWKRYSGLCWIYSSKTCGRSWLCVHCVYCEKWNMGQRQFI